MNNIKYKHVSLTFRMGTSERGFPCWVDASGKSMSDVLTDIGEEGWQIASTLQVQDEIWIFVSRVMQHQ